MNIGNYFRRYKWDIGIALISEGHKYDNEHWYFHIVKAPKDRWFADPFILDVTDNEIIVLAEEYSYKLKKGRLAKLVINKHNYRLKGYKIIFELPSHLSFPIFFKGKDNIYIYPENSENGCCLIYKYDVSLDVFTPIDILCIEPLTDAAIITIAEMNYLISTKIPTQNSNILQIYRSKSLIGQYREFQNITLNDNIARGAGNIFIDNNRIIRPAQNCNGRYGMGLVFQELFLHEDGKISLKELFRKNPPRGYEGMHTYNLNKGYVVVDLHKRRYPKIFKSLQYLKHLLKGRSNTSLI